MKLFRSVFVFVSMLCLSPSASAGVFKCTDVQGNTSYQAAPCAEENSAAEINIKTGGSVDLSNERSKQEEELKQQQDKINSDKELEETRVKEAKHQSALNQQLIQNNPIQFTAFSIPPYLPEKLSELVKPFEARLPEIEKFRRFAAQKALASGECKRVESDQLSIKSTLDVLVFSIDCSTAKTFTYNETELVK